MPVNGFVLGRRLWVEIVCGSVRADFIGVVSSITETGGEHYHLQFRGGFDMNFTITDLREGRVVAHDMDLRPDAESSGGR